MSFFFDNWTAIDRYASSLVFWRQKVIFRIYKTHGSFSIFKFGEMWVNDSRKWTTKTKSNNKNKKKKNPQLSFIFQTFDRIIPPFLLKLYKSSILTDLEPS